MKFKKIAGIIHLWLGLISGLLVFIIAITGSIYVFKEEIQNATQPYRFVKEQQAAFLPPSALIARAEDKLPGKHVHAVQYEGKAKAAKVIYYQGGEDEYYYFVYMNPYSGEVLQVSDELSGFFSFVLDGHFYLWLPDDIGKPIVASATLVFLVMVISGIILWWPRNKAGRKKRFSIKWSARWRRRNYDMHNVLGFYASWVALIFAITGLVWGFEWFRDSYYTVISGGADYIEYTSPVSETAPVSDSTPAIDRVYYLMKNEYPADAAIEVHTPEDSLTGIAANVNPEPGTYWKIDYRYFDQYSMKELSVNHMWGRFDSASNPEKLMRMNYDIHVGAVLGLPGKILAFLASLIIASLPITGFLIWRGRRKKTRVKVTDLIK